MLKKTYSLLLLLLLFSIIIIIIHYYYCCHCLSGSESLQGGPGVQVVAAAGGGPIAVATLLLPGQVAAVQSGRAQAGHQLHVRRGKHSGQSQFCLRGYGWIFVGQGH